MSDSGRQAPGPSSTPRASVPRPSLLDGVSFGRLERQVDARGSFRELWREDAFAAVPASAGRLAGLESDAAQAAGLDFVQANLSTSAPGVLRGLHLHRRQLDHWVVAAGRAFVALVDVRPLLAGRGRCAVETRVLGADETVTIPAGVAHGFLALEPLELIYLVTNTYDGSDELGFAWDDPEAAVPWPPVGGGPGERPILSPRDSANPSLAELMAHLRA